MSVRLLPPLCLCVLPCLAFIKLLAPASSLLLGLCQGGGGQISSVFTAENSLPLEFCSQTSRCLSFSLSRPAQHTRSSTLNHLNIIMLPMLNANQTAAPHTQKISILRVLIMVNQAAISHTTNEVACCGGSMRPPTHTHTHTHSHCNEST